MVRATIFLAGVVLAPVAAAWAQENVDLCGVIIKGEDGAQRVVDIPGFTVTGMEEFLLPTGYEDATAVVCQRSELSIGEQDHLVLLQGGVPLFIRSGERTLILQMKTGQFYAEYEGGELSEDEATQIQSALDKAQEKNQQSAS